MQNSFNPKGFYSYFKDCFLSDFQEFYVKNVFATKYKYKWFAKKEEFLTEGLSLIPYENTKLKELETDIELNKLEKDLLYFNFLIVGKNTNHFTKEKYISAPLVLCKSEIKSNDDFSLLNIDTDSLFLNRQVLPLLKEKTNKQEIENILCNIQHELIDNYLTLQRLISNLFENLNTEFLKDYPKLWSKSKIQNFLKDTDFNDEEYYILPCSGTIFTEKTNSSLKINNDLDQLIAAEDFNASLAELLSFKSQKIQIKESLVKGNLNAEQNIALANAKNYTNSVIIGPPGTGKSYTLINIVLDAVLNSKSVLVVSKTKTAVDVIRQKLTDEFSLKDFIIQTSNKNYKSSIVSKIKKRLYTPNNIVYNPKYLEDLKMCYRSITSSEAKFRKALDREIVHDNLSQRKLTFKEKWKKFFLRFSQLELMEVRHNLEAIIHYNYKLSDLIKKSIKHELSTKSISKNARLSVSYYYDALNSKTFTNYKNLLAKLDFRHVLELLPIWLADLSELNSVIPFQKELFDYVIIDEATQCDIATALPAIYRGKKVVVSGDPNQLKHYSFVSQRKQDEFRKKYQLKQDKIFDFRNRSILDFYVSRLENQGQLSMLKEHFRSSHSLIEFSNQEFYDGELNIMKTVPHETMRKQFEVFETNGIRDKKGINTIEANLIIEKLTEIVKQNSNQNHYPSVGIIAFVQTQAIHINKLIKANFDLKTIKKFKLFCGTPYQFQGSEREIVLCSFVVTDNCHPMAFKHINTPEVFNVGITRAKSFQYIYHSTSANYRKKDSILSRYLNFLDGYKYNSIQNIKADHFQLELMSELETRGLDLVLHSYPIAGHLLDIFIMHNDKYYFVDLIGYQGNFSEPFSFERYKTLSRAKIITIPLNYKLWQKNKNECISYILDRIALN